MHSTIATELAAIAEQVRTCRRCPGLNEPGLTQSAPGYGSPNSPVVIVGQSLCRPCMAAQIPFTGGSGKLLDCAFSIAGLGKEQIFITNIVHCHPPGNRPSRPTEIENCTEYLRRELAAVHPRLVVGLGADARDWLLSWAGSEALFWPLSYAVSMKKGEWPALLLLHHPAYIARKSQQERAQYVARLAEALRWSFEKPERQD
jgi:uracil-DNA glycosylase